MAHVQFEFGFERFHAQVVRAANARRAVGVSAGVGAHFVHELPQGLHAGFGVGYQKQGRAGHQRHRLQLFAFSIGGGFVDQRGDGQHGAVGHDKAVVVIGASHQVLESHHTVATGLVVDHHGLAQALGEFLRHDAGHRIGQTAGRVGHDEFDRLGRKALGAGDQGQGGNGQGQSGQISAFHGESPRGSEGIFLGG